MVANKSSAMAMDRDGGGQASSTAPGRSWSRTVYEILREADIKQAEVLQAMLATIGFDATINVLERTAWQAAVKTESTFQLATSNWSWWE